MVCRPVVEQSKRFHVAVEIFRALYDFTQLGRPSYKQAGLRFLLFEINAVLAELVTAELQDVDRALRGKVKKIHDDLQTWVGVGVDRSVFIIRDVACARRFLVWRDADEGNAAREVVSSIGVANTRRRG